MSSELQIAISRCREGDTAAFKVIVKAFERRVLTIAYSILGNSEEALEVMQETFFRVYKNLGRIKNEAGFARFVCKVAANYSIDMKRRRNGRHYSLDDEAELPASVKLQLSLGSTEPDTVVERNEMWQALKKAVAGLPEKQRMTLVLHDIDGLPKAEIANIMGCPQGTVRSNLHIARKKLQSKLKEYR
jgi:RNA polymerase sigma-70 factor (ECF subfamily)